MHKQQIISSLVLDLQESLDESKLSKHWKTGFI